ncbi:hypothetical protein N1F33_19310 [Pseudomonas aeruginosa]|nr:hypothetical protein [Pseudomonas aeruginosa]MCS8109558.1 hypothetical protein [Pseudomonas aeruginosa]MCS8762534.1 hypothetical protein [Pseudomonas aeruginosa]MCS8929579.1 hypothetical protein [Pseudomonas aeruginosa]
MHDMREEFEAWVTAAMGGYADLRKSNDPNFAYDDVDVDFAYQAWQASRAALRVELPAGKPWFVAVTEEEELRKQRGYGWNDCLDAVGEILWKAGIEVAK